MNTGWIDNSLTSAWGIHCLLAGDHCNSKGDGERIGTSQVAMPGPLGLKELGPITPHPAPLIWGTCDNGGLFNPAQSQEGCLSQPHKGAAQMGDAYSCPAMVPIGCEVTACRAHACSSYSFTAHAQAAFVSGMNPSAMPCEGE